MGAKCAEPARVGTVSSWSLDLKFQLGYMEIEAMLLVWWVKEGEKTSTLVDYFGIILASAKRALGRGEGAADMNGK